MIETRSVPLSTSSVIIEKYLQFLPRICMICALWAAWGIRVQYRSTLNGIDVVTPAPFPCSTIAKNPDEKQADTTTIMVIKRNDIRCPRSKNESGAHQRPAFFVFLRSRFFRPAPMPPRHTSPYFSMKARTLLLLTRVLNF